MEEPLLPEHEISTGEEVVRSSPSPSEDDDPVQFIEIAIGERRALRGPKAVRAAIVNDYYVPKVYFGCSLDLFCIKDAQYLVCPVCNVVSPMDLESSSDATSSPVRQHGACKGFTFESLFEMQAEIMKEDSTSQNS